MNAKYFYPHNKNYLAVYIENYGFLSIHAVPSREIPFLSPPLPEQLISKTVIMLSPSSPGFPPLLLWDSEARW